MAYKIRDELMKASRNNQNEIEQDKSSGQKLWEATKDRFSKKENKDSNVKNDLQ